jgi:hypothetical protein
MRISALAGGEEVVGMITENGNVVGEFTTSGTLELILFSGFFPGLILGPVYGIIRGWLSGPTLVRGSLYGVLLLAVFGGAVINRDNRDFVELGPPALNVAMFSLLIVLFGMATAIAAAWWDPRLPRVAELRRRKYWYPYAAVPALLLLFPLGAAGGMLVAGAVLAGALALYALADIWYPRAARVLAVFLPVRRVLPYLLLGVPAVIGSFFLARSVVAILG